MEMTMRYFTAEHEELHQEVKAFVATGVQEKLGGLF